MGFISFKACVCWVGGNNELTLADTFTNLSIKLGKIEVIHNLGIISCQEIGHFGVVFASLHDYYLVPFVSVRDDQVLGFDLESKTFCC